jgi:hypothetical protein
MAPAARAILGLVALGAAWALAAASAQAATEVVAGVISCTPSAPRTATMNGSSGLLEGEFACSSRPANGDCSEQIRRDLSARGCAFRRDNLEEGSVLYFTCSGPRADLIALIDQVCRRLNGF